MYETDLFRICAANGIYKEHADEVIQGTWDRFFTNLDKFEESKEGLIKQKKLTSRIAVALVPGKTFYPAKDCHQSSYAKNPIRYNYYRFACGRAKRLKVVWGQSSDH